MRYAIMCAIALAVGVAGCETAAPCVTEEKIIEVIYSWGDAGRIVLDRHVEQGWTCNTWGSIPGGMRYKCTICR